MTRSRNTKKKSKKHSKKGSGEGGDCTQWIDHLYYPIIMDSILDYAEHDVLLAFRRTSKEYLERADARLFKHIVLGPHLPWTRYMLGDEGCVDEDDDEWDDIDHEAEVLKMAVSTPWGDKLPGIVPVDYAQWVEGTPADEVAQEERYLERFRHTRVIDVADADDDSLQWFAEELVQGERQLEEHGQVKVFRLFPNFPAGPQCLGDKLVVFPPRLARPRGKEAVPNRHKHAVPSNTREAVHIVRVRPDLTPIFDYGHYEQEPTYALKSETFVFTHARPHPDEVARFYKADGKPKTKNKNRWDDLVSALARRLVRHDGSRAHPIACTVVDFDVLQPDWVGLDVAHAQMPHRLLYDIENLLRTGVSMGRVADDDREWWIEQTNEDALERAKFDAVDKLLEAELGCSLKEHGQRRGGAAPTEEETMELMALMDKCWKKMEANPPKQPATQDMWLPLTGTQTLSEDLIANALEHITLLSAAEYAKTRSEAELFFEAVPNGYFDQPDPDSLKEGWDVRPSWTPWEKGRCGL